MAAKPAEKAAFDVLLQELNQPSKRPLAIFLGAGASKTFGYPITRELMLKIFDGLRKGRIFQGTVRGRRTLSSNPGTELHKFLRELLPGERYSKAKMPMVTGVLSLLDFSLATGQALLPGYTLDDTRRVRQLLDQSLLAVIPHHEGSTADEKRLFRRFQLWLTSLKALRPPGKMAIITTNYDMIADFAALYVAGVSRTYDFQSFRDLGKKVDFGFRWVRPDRLGEEFISRPESPFVALYKLHGSINWLRCPLCESLYIDPLSPMALFTSGKESAWYAKCHCSETQLETQLVSPSFIREMREPNLVAIWKSTLDFLREADRWIIIGYSFPDEDMGIRALFTRAFGSKQSRPKISVVQLNDDARVNYESFFPGRSVQYFTGGLSVLLDRWQKEFGAGKEIDSSLGTPQRDVGVTGIFRRRGA